MSIHMDFTIEELLQREDDWWERENESSISWINEGIELFTLFMKKDPYNLRYSEMLSYLLLRQGEDTRFQKQAYERVINVLEHLVQVDSTNALAFYRLGFLYFFQKKWAKSINSFQKSLTCTPEFSRNRLNKEQQIKANYYILQASQYIVKNSIDYMDATPEYEWELYREIHYLIQEINSGKRNITRFPYQMLKNGKEFTYLSFREFEKLSDPKQNENVAILNQHSINETYFSYKYNETRLLPTQVPLIEYIMRHPEGVSRKELVERKFYESVNPRNTLTDNIRSLMERLNEIDASINFIISIDGGYKWNSQVEYRMFKKTMDVSGELIIM